MSVEEKAALQEDLATLSVNDYTARADHWFEWVFGGRDATAVNRYLKERVQVIYGDDPEKTKGCVVVTPRRAEAVWNADSTITTQAFNIGVSLWYYSLTLDAGERLVCPYKPAESAAMKWVEVKDTRAGLVRLAKNYIHVPKKKKFSWEEDQLVARASFERIGTLIHEARHSDCRDGITEQDRQAILRDEEPENRSCGYLHIRCPETFETESGLRAKHPYAGTFSCDSEAWGPYAVEAIFYMNYEKNCVGCDHKKKQLAQLLKIDKQIRYWPLLRKMVDGELGKPDMGSRGYLN